MTTRYAHVSDDQIALTSTPRPHSCPPDHRAVERRADPDRQPGRRRGGGGDNPGGKGAAGKTRAMVKTSTRTTARPRCPTCPPTPSVNSPPSPMAAWAAPPHLRRWRRRRAAYFGGANATITVRSNLLGGSGWVGYSSTDGSGGGGDGLIVMDGKVNVTATGQLVGGDATYSMGGRPGSGGAGYTWTKARSRMPALSSAAWAVTTTAQPLRHRPRRRWRRRGRAAQWPHGQ